jgi:DNA primase
MLYDMDSAGQMATLRSLDILLEEDMHVRIATLAADEDPDSFIQKFGVEPFKDALKTAQSLFDFKLALLREMHGAATIEGRAKICQEMIPTIDKVPNEVVKSEYYRELALQLNVSEAALLKERDKLKGKTPKSVDVRDHSIPPAPQKLKPPPKDESVLLRLMLSDPKWITHAKGSVTAECFSDSSIRSIVERIFTVTDEMREVSAAEFVQHFGESRETALITGLLEDNDEPGVDRERIFNDCLVTVASAWRKKEREKLSKEIRLAEQEGNRDKVLELQREFNQLIPRVVR